MTATVVPIASDPKKAQAIADSHGLLLLADGRMVREYRYDADIVSIGDWMRSVLRPDHNGPEAA